MADELERYELRSTGLDSRELKDKVARLFESEGGELTGPSKRPQRVKKLQFFKLRVGRMRVRDDRDGGGRCPEMTHGNQSDDLLRRRVLP
jgi:hypothetical protein